MPIQHHAKTPLRLAVFALAACVLVVRCEPERRGRPAVVPMTSHAAPRARLSDSEISTAVLRELALDPAFPRGAVQATTTAGVVQLTGEVGTLLAKERATRHAEVVRGVRAVSNRIEVARSNVTEAVLRADIRTAWLLDPAADAYEITAIPRDDGVVRLEGVVQSQQEKQLAERLAKGVRGVREVENDIRIEYPAMRRDDEIARDVQARLRWDVLVQDGLLDVSVDAGKVTLSGIVGSAADKSRAYWDAWVQGVRDVDDSAVDVRWWADKNDLRAHKYVRKEPAELERAVHDALLLDPRVSAHALQVRAAEDAITLTGRVGSERARRAAEQLAMHTVGVLGVINRITVDSGAPPPSDEALRERVDTALLLSPEVERYRVATKVEGGEVTLTGTVDSALEKLAAEDIVSGLRGVRSVHNDLQVLRNMFVFIDPYVYPYVPDGHPAPPPRPATKSDAAIARDIRTELFWSPFIDADEIEVTVHDGKATLTGTVGTWHERSVATKNALEGGAISVDNELRVAPAPS